MLQKSWVQVSHGVMLFSWKRFQIFDFVINVGLRLRLRRLFNPASYIWELLGGLHLQGVVNPTSWAYRHLVCGMGHYFVYIVRECADAIPHYQKFCTRVTHIWGNRKRQPNRGAMVRPPLGGSAACLLTDL